jgi:hypothetical protein
MSSSRRVTGVRRGANPLDLVTGRPQELVHSSTVVRRLHRHVHDHIGCAWSGKEAYRSAEHVELAPLDVDLDEIDRLDSFGGEEGI